MRTTPLCPAVFVLIAALATASPGRAQTAGQYEPKVGQAGKDVVWVPTPPEMVEKMLDLASVKPSDLVVDLGSGDGRNVIAAAKRGARALGVEFNPDLVELSRRNAESAGVADRATFVQGDMFEADISQATVLALFLLPDNLNRLMPKFLALPPGTRIVANTFGLTGWTPEATVSLEDGCRSWCEAMLYIVPAQVGGTWKLDDGTLEVKQEAQTITGTMTVGGRATVLENGSVRGNVVRFESGGRVYDARLVNTRLEGTVAPAVTPAAGTAVKPEPFRARRDG